jgi:ParB family chromosome partitioning protein
MSNPCKLDKYLLTMVDLTDIDLTDQRYKISVYDPDITFLARSIKEIGLNCPVTVRPFPNNDGNTDTKLSNKNVQKYIIVSGFNRVRAQIFNNDTSIPAYKIDTEASDYQCLLKSITALSFQRPLTHGELIIGAKRLSQYLDVNQIAEKSSAILNIELNVKFIKDLLKIGALPDPALKLIHDNKLTLKSAKRIAGYDSQTINALLNLFSSIKASSSKQLEIIQFFMEICARDKIKPTEIFQNPEIQSIVLDKDKDLGLKTNLLRTWLYDLRFPNISKTQKKVKSKISSIKLGNKIKFTPPVNFESPNYNIAFLAKNYDEFKSNVNSLNAALATKALKEIFDQ